MGTRAVWEIPLLVGKRPFVCKWNGNLYSPDNYVGARQEQLLSWGTGSFFHAGIRRIKNFSG